jgi:hypothetical protein
MSTDFPIAAFSGILIEIEGTGKTGLLSLISSILTEMLHI